MGELAREGRAGSVSHRQQSGGLRTSRRDDPMELAERCPDGARRLSWQVELDQEDSWGLGVGETDRRVLCRGDNLVPF